MIRSQPQTPIQILQRVTVPKRTFRNSVIVKAPYRDCVEKARMEITRKHVDNLDKKLSQANELLYKYANRQRLSQQDICTLNDLQYYHRKEKRAIHANAKNALEYEIIVLSNRLKQEFELNNPIRNTGNLGALKAEYEIQTELRKVKAKLRQLETMSERELMSSNKF